MKNVTEKIIASILMFVMIFNFGSVSLAEGLKLAKVKGENPEEQQLVDSITEEEKLEIVGEQLDKRKLNEKHFILSNGSTLVAKYSENVHYEKDGKMIDIDNSLKEAQLENETVYRNKSNSYEVDFAKTSEEDKKIASLKSEGYEINWLMQSVQKETQKEEKTQEKEKKKEEKTKEKISKVEAKVIEKEQKAKATNATNKSIEEKTNLENVSSSITYENILNKIDLQYDIKAESIKESIIINDKEGLQDEFVFKFNTGELKAELLENKEIVIYKENKENYTFKIDAPYMFDSNLEYSSDIEITLDKDENTKEYILKIIPNKEWIESEERVYPITIDPTVSTSRYYEDIKDTYIFEGDESSNTRHRAHIIRIGSNNKSGPHKNPTRGLIKFTLPELNAGDQVIYASLNICSYPDTNEWAPPGREMQIDVHKMTSNWEEESAHWSNLSNLYNNIIEDYEKYTFDYNNQCKFYGFNITSIAKEWYTTGNNYGLMLKEHYEQYNYPESDAYFISANTYKETYYYARPVVTIVYRNQTGIEDYLSYHTQNIGRAGTVYTNDYNGNLVLTHQDASTPGSRFPVSINHVFNTNDKNIDIGYGAGYRLNLSQILEKTIIGDVDYTKYIDEDGTAHYFREINGEWTDEDGLGLTIEMSGTNVIMKDKKGNKSTFQKYSIGDKWHLKEIEDTNGNKITLTLGIINGEYVVTKATDAAGDSIILTYLNNLLYSITESEKTIYYGYQGNNLKSITYTDGKVSEYKYDSNHTLTCVKNVDNSYIEYEFYEGLTSRVKNIKEYGADGTLGNTLSIKYEQNLTTITDNSGYKNTYNFNNYGQAINIADFGKGMEDLANAYGKSYQYGTSNGSKNKLTLESKLVAVNKLPNNLLKNPEFMNGLEGWTTNFTNANDVVVNANGTNGTTNAYSFTGESSLSKDIRQSIDITGNKGDSFSIYGWAKNQGVPNMENDFYKSAGILIRIHGTDGEQQDVYTRVTSGVERMAIHIKTSSCGF